MMKLADAILKKLRSYRQNSEDDNIRYKQIIKQKLLENDTILYLINNKELQDRDADADEYYNTNILAHYIIPDTQHNVQNFICFETSCDDVSRSNTIMKNQQIIFYILCHRDDLNVKEVNVDRHDLIAAVLKEMFQGCNDFGSQLKLVQDKPGVVDTQYCSRTLIFKQITPNDIVKNGKAVGLKRGY